MFFKSKLKKQGYQSELDLFFHSFDENREEFPESRLDESEMYRIIFEKRDTPFDEPISKIWSRF